MAREFLARGDRVRFEAPERVYEHVGWDTQTTQAGFEARLQNIGWGAAWMAMGVVYMLVAQVVVRWLMGRARAPDARAAHERPVRERSRSAGLWTSVPV